MEKPLKTQGSFVENIYNQQRHRIKGIYLVIAVLDAVLIVVFGIAAF